MIDKFGYPPREHDYQSKNPFSLALLSLEELLMDFKMENGGDKIMNLTVKALNLYDFRYFTSIQGEYRSILYSFNDNIFDGDQTHTTTLNDNHEME